MATGEWSFISALGHNLLFPLRNGVTCAVLSGRATPGNVLEQVATFGVTLLHSVAHGLSPDAGYGGHRGRV